MYLRHKTLTGAEFITESDEPEHIKTFGYQSDEQRSNFTYAPNPLDYNLPNILVDIGWCSVGVGNGLVHGPYESIKHIQYIILKYEGYKAALKKIRFHSEPLRDYETNIISLIYEIAEEALDA